MTLPSAALSLPERLAPELRSGAAVRRGDVPAVVGRIEGGRLLLDLRAVAPTDDERLAAAVLTAAAPGAAAPARRLRRSLLPRPGLAVHVIATAGHVDHGKSMLVRTLTGMEPDRWEAEQRRGMTIDLGFAWMTLPSGEEIAFVDVPGHERFITNMLAGAGPAPGVLFVVAADEGWMPQSAEHLAAIDALGVGNGLLVVTRADLADPAPALEQATLKIADSSLGEVEAIAVSALTGQGLPELVAALGRLVARLPEPDPGGSVRLWLDRVFAIKGSGTVVTGTLQAGTVRTGDELTC